MTAHTLFCCFWWLCVFLLHQTAVSWTHCCFLITMTALGSCWVWRGETAQAKVMEDRGQTWDDVFQAPHIFPGSLTQFPSFPHECSLRGNSLTPCLGRLCASWHIENKKKKSLTNSKCLETRDCIPISPTYLHPKKARVMKLVLNIEPLNLGILRELFS